MVYTTALQRSLPNDNIVQLNKVPFALSCHGSCTIHFFFLNNNFIESTLSQIVWISCHYGLKINEAGLSPSGFWQGSGDFSETSAEGSFKCEMQYSIGSFKFFLPKHIIHCCVLIFIYSLFSFLSLPSGMTLFF